MKCFGTTDFDNNSRLITLSMIIISGLLCVYTRTHAHTHTYTHTHTHTHTYMQWNFLWIALINLLVMIHFLSSCLCIQNITLPSIYIFLLESNNTHIFMVWIWVYLRSSNDLLKLCADGIWSHFEIFMWGLSRGISLMGNKQYSI